MRRRFAAIALTVCGALTVAFWADAALAERRVALVIGNSDYAKINPLVNPANDAPDIAAALQKVGFEVIVRTNLAKGGFDRALAEFARKANGADSALFYYAGHGLQYQKQNYLLPTDIEVEDYNDVEFQAVGMDRILAALARTSGVKIVVLDACRDNPLSTRVATRSIGDGGAGTTRGLARLDRTEGLVIAYATGPDQVAQDGAGRNSPFTTAMVNRLREPGLEIATMFRRVTQDVYEATNGRQRPEVSISLLSDYYLNLAETDSLAWARVRDSSSAQDFEQFIQRYPSSAFAREAQFRLDLFARLRRENEDRLRLAAGDDERRRREAEDRLRQETDRVAAQRRADDERFAALAAQRKQQEDELLRQREADRVASDKRAEQDRLATLARQQQQQDAEAARLREADRLAALQRAEQDRLAAVKSDAERLAAAKAEIARQDAEKLALQKQAERDRLVAAKAEADRLAAVKAEAARVEADRVIAQKKADMERLATAKADADRIAAEKAIAAREAAEQVLAARKAEQERLAAAKAETQRLAAEKELADRQEAERVAAARRAEQERIQTAARDDAERKRQVEEAARQKVAEVCTQEAAELSRIAGQKLAMQDLRGRIQCPSLGAQIDTTLKAIAAAEVKACDADRKALTSLRKDDLGGLKTAYGAMTCEAVRSDAGQRLAALEDELQKRAQVCSIEGEQVASARDAAPEDAKTRLVTLQGTVTCSNVKPIIAAALRDVEARLPKVPDIDTPRQIRAAQVELTRLGCFVGKVSDQMTPAAKDGLARYLAKRGSLLADASISDEFLNEMKQQNKDLCPPAANAVVAHGTDSIAPADVDEAPVKRHRVAPIETPRAKRQIEVERPAPAPRAKVAVRPAPAAAPIAARPVASAAPAARAPMSMQGIGF